MLKHKVSNKKVLLLDPGKNGGTIYGNSTNLGLFVLAETARKIGWQAEVVNLRNNEYDLSELISTYQPSVVGFTSTSPAHGNAIERARKILEINPNIVLLKGGTHETYAAKYVQAKKEYPIDISFIGEADRSFPLVL